MHLLTLIFGIVLLPGAYTLRCNKCIPTSSGGCVNTEKICSAHGYQCASVRMISYAGGLKVSDLQMKSCVVQEQCGETSINFGLGRHVITTECCAIDFCNTKPASEPSRHTPNGKKCYHCNGPKCTATLNCEGNEDHCITKTVISGEKQEIIKGCASSKMCSSTVNAEIKGAIGGTFTCCQGDYCNSASSTSAGLLLLVAPLVSFVMFS
ncbi:ly6/PLAUR domain-containing protein 3-like [Larimichthys crocea]|uniref:ly6/PLAUR domain-containing protein 3-like n=1 Tax=Larimichthys crocea TaxID=215358 RepID=UPI000F5D7FF5|nr:ly6/PLAUR domain-containing protein 3-like [Larimichthys crocea]